MVQKSSMSRTPSTSTQEIQMDMFDHQPHTQVRQLRNNQADVTDAVNKIKGYRFFLQPNKGVLNESKAVGD